MSENEILEIFDSGGDFSPNFLADIEEDFLIQKHFYYDWDTFEEEEICCHFSVLRIGGRDFVLKYTEDSCSLNYSSHLIEVVYDSVNKVFINKNNSNEIFDFNFTI